MAEYRPHRPLAANIHIMQRTVFEQAGICRIGILQDPIVENCFLNWSNGLHSPSPSTICTSRRSPAKHTLIFSADIEFKWTSQQMASIRRQTSSILCIFPFTIVGGVIKIIWSP